MVKWARELYIGDKIKKNASYAIDCINEGKAINKVYIIVFASQPNNLFDIMKANELLCPHYKSVDIKIVGLAKDEDEAVDLVHNMVMDVYRSTGDFNVRTYFT